VAVTLLYTIGHHWSDPSGECDAPPQGGGSGQSGVALASRYSADEMRALQSDVRTWDGPTANWLKPRLLSESDLLWSYDGFGEMSMGNSDPESLRLRFLNLARLPERPQDFPHGTPLRDVNELLREAERAREAAEASWEESSNSLDKAPVTRPSQAEEWLAEAMDGDDLEDLEGEEGSDLDLSSWSELEIVEVRAWRAGLASAAMAKALGIESPFMCNLSWVIESTEQRVGRPASEEERVKTLLSWANVGYGAPVQWGGIVQQERFLKYYEDMLLSMHGLDNPELFEELIMPSERGNLAERAQADSSRRMAAKKRQQVLLARKKMISNAAAEEARLMWGVLDPLGRGFVTTRDILRVPRRAIVSVLKVGAAQDPSNTDEWEYYLTDPAEVASMLAKSWMSEQEVQRTANEVLQQISSGPKSSTSNKLDPRDEWLLKAAAAGCGVFDAIKWRGMYLELLKGSDTAADKVQTMILGAALSGDSVCGSEDSTTPPALVRPKTTVEGGDPASQVAVLIAMSREQFDHGASEVIKLYSRELERDPALDSLDGLELS
jgi:hypothetical protein